MPGKPITLTQSEYDILFRTKKAYEGTQGEAVDWGQFLLFLLSLYIEKTIQLKGNEG